MNLYESIKNNLKESEYLQKFIDYAKPRIDNDLKNTDIAFTQKIKGEDAQILFNDDDSDILRYKIGNDVRETPMITTDTLASRLEFDKINETFYDQIITYWDDLALDEQFEEFDESAFLESSTLKEGALENNLESVFKRIKTILDDGGEKELEDGYYFPVEALNILNSVGTDFFMNSYMSLTKANVLNLIDNNDSIDGVKTELFDEYNDSSANAWYENFLEILTRISKIDTKYFEESSTLKEGSKSENILNKVFYYVNRDIADKVMGEIYGMGDREGWSAGQVIKMNKVAPYLEINRNGQAPVSAEEVKKLIEDKFSEVRVDIDTNPIVAEPNLITVFVKDTLEETEEELPEKIYTYVSTHGIGPGSLPTDVKVIATKEIRPGRIKLFLDRILTPEEISKYDIKDEWIQESANKERAYELVDKLNAKAQELTTLVAEWTKEGSNKDAEYQPKFDALEKEWDILYADYYDFMHTNKIKDTRNVDYSKIPFTSRDYIDTYLKENDLGGNALIVLFEGLEIPKEFLNNIKNVQEMYRENMENDDVDSLSGTEDSYANEMINQDSYDAIVGVVQKDTYDQMASMIQEIGRNPEDFDLEMTLQDLLIALIENDFDLDDYFKIK